MPSLNRDVIIIGTGPAGLGAAFHLTEQDPSLSILMIDREKICSGGLLNDCKQNYTYPIGFSAENWTKDEAERLLPLVENRLRPVIKEKQNLTVYQRRAERVGVSLLDVRQSHVGTDKSRLLIQRLVDELKSRGVSFALEQEAADVFDDDTGTGVAVSGAKRERARKVIVAPGRKGFSFLQQVMERLGISYMDNTVDVGIRVETTVDNYPIVNDYYDPKFFFPDGVRTFCTNSGHARVVLEHYQGFSLVNGHAFSTARAGNNLANFALLKTIGLKDPIRSGQQMAVFLARLANDIGGGKPLMQRVGDFRMGKRSSTATFNDDLYAFPPSCPVTAGDLGLAVPSRIMRHLWAALKKLDSIVPGVLHPSTIMYYPEIKMYANKPDFLDRHFRVTKNVYMVGDGAGTSRGITGAWASGIRAAEGILQEN
ncbi:MAG: pyridine nucleotide-disulfide oxidoreductase [Elusimicrobia bacterium GWA2_56_46]|nr:MAG: pyridine nucleotide-disulfide oxidoreductase [Elusimicrobia bacterium GWA2_56_46]OGR55549.1 MAG: pyridine nucleotide-disulfide oxidoreductase [Elusimicrobia bacterium GWC2_56_31]HBW22049.1 pyridine nucleotide-disulfide oxidoreductase [Elusimicrobiota bacterium]